MTLSGSGIWRTMSPTVAKTSMEKMMDKRAFADEEIMAAFLSIEIAYFYILMGKDKKSKKKLEQNKLPQLFTMKLYRRLRLLDSFHILKPMDSSFSRMMIVLKQVTMILAVIPMTPETIWLPYVLPLPRQGRY